jgi:hypothetical protein
MNLNDYQFEPVLTKAKLKKLKADRPVKRAGKLMLNPGHKNSRVITPNLLKNQDSSNQEC